MYLVLLIKMCLLINLLSLPFLPLVLEYCGASLNVFLNKNHNKQLTFRLHPATCVPFIASFYTCSHHTHTHTHTYSLYRYGSH